MENTNKKNNAGFESFGPQAGVPSASKIHHLFFLSLFSLLIFSSSISAVQDWKPAVISAVLVSVFALIIAYMLIHVLHWDQFKGLIKDELGQTLVTFILVVVLVAGLPELESLTAKGVCGFSGMTSGSCSYPAPVPPNGDYLPFCKTIADSTSTPPGPACPITGTQPLNTWAVSVNANEQVQLNDAMTQTLKFTKDLGYVSSVSGFCNMLGVGFSIAGCSTYGVLRGPTGQMLNAIGTGMMDLQAEKILLNMNTTGFTLSLLLPLGILLRAMHWTRKAGGTLIALTLSLYFVFPTVLLLGQGMADQFIKPGEKYENYKGLAFPPLGTNYNPLDSSTIECNPYDPKISKLLGTMNSFLARQPPAGVPVYYDVRYPSDVDKILYIVMIRNLMMTVLALTATLATTRVLGQGLGAEVDVWGIARLS